MLDKLAKDKQRLAQYLLDEFNVQSSIIGDEHNIELLLHTNPEKHEASRKFAEKYWSNGCKVPIHHRIKHIIKRYFKW